MFLNRVSFLLRSPSVGILSNAIKSLSVAPATSQTLLTTAAASVRSRSYSALVSPQANSSVLKDVKAQIESGSEGRLFAVIQLCGKQFKVTSGDVIVVEGYWPPTNGDQIRLDKVLLAGGKDFSLIGRPLVPAGLVDIQGTVIEKSLSHTRTHFRKKRRKQYMRINFQRNQQTMIRINSIELSSQRFTGEDKTSKEAQERFF